MGEADGWGWRAWRGALTPHAGIGSAAEFRAAPAGELSQVACAPPKALALGHDMDAAIARDMVYACTSALSVDGAAGLSAAALHAIACAALAPAGERPCWTGP